MPPDYLDKPLDTKARNQLIEDIHFPKKWTSFKKWLEQSSTYTILKKKIKGNEYWVISFSNAVK